MAWPKKKKKIFQNSKSCETTDPRSPEKPKQDLNKESKHQGIPIFKLLKNKDKEKILKADRGKKKHIQKTRDKNYSRLLVINHIGQKMMKCLFKVLNEKPVNP